MKKLIKNSLIILITGSSSFITILAMATNPLPIPADLFQHPVYFECTVSDANADVHFQTNQVDVWGFCNPKGQANLKGDAVNQYYFKARPYRLTEGKITVTITNGKGVVKSCRIGSGSKSPYPAAIKEFCSVAPVPQANQ